MTHFGHGIERFTDEYLHCCFPLARGGSSYVGTGVQHRLSPINQKPRRRSVWAAEDIYEKINN
jgi:hypothetical protein